MGGGVPARAFREHPYSATFPLPRNPARNRTRLAVPTVAGLVTALWTRSFPGRLSPPRWAGRPIGVTRRRGSHRREVVTNRTAPIVPHGLKRPLMDVT